jgi:acyl-CoA hydrolase
MVTVSSDKIDFKIPIPHGTIIELVGKVTYLGTTSLKVRVDIFIEKMYDNYREKAITGEFTFVAIDDDKKAVLVNSINYENKFFIFLNNLSVNLSFTFFVL